MTFDFLSVVPYSKIVRIKRIANVFCTRNEGPYRVAGDCIHIIADDTVKVGNIDIKHFGDGYYYFSVVIDQVCYSYDDKYHKQFFEYVQLLLWLDEMWGITEHLDCPICHESVEVNDNIKLLIDHIQSEHKSVEVRGLESCGYDVKLRTNIGDYILEGCKIY